MLRNEQNKVVLWKREEVRVAGGDEISKLCNVHKFHPSNVLSLSAVPREPDPRERKSNKFSDNMRREKERD